MNNTRKLFSTGGKHEGRWNLNHKNVDIAVVVIATVLAVLIFALALKISVRITGREFAPVWDRTERVLLVEAETDEAAPADTQEDETFQKDKELLAIGIYVITGGCNTSDYSLIMAGNVIQNRVEGHRYPDTLEEVLTQPAQFGALEQTGAKWPTGATAEAKEKALTAAERVLNGERVLQRDVVYVSNTRQGETVAMLDGLYFCR